MADELRIGIIGVNGIGQWHLWALRQSERSNAAAVCDIDLTRAEKAAAEHGVPAFGDAKSLFESGTVDAVVVGTPAGTHGQIARAALDAGLHVYCEKPIAPTADEGYALARHAHEAKRVLQVGFQFRFHKGYAALRAAAATIAPLTRLNLNATNWFRAQRYFDASPWRSSWSMAGGGVLMNQAIHQLDALVSVAGLPMRVRGQVRSTRHRTAVEDDAIALLEWESGATGTLVASLADPAGYERIELFGDRGAVRLSNGYEVRMTQHDDAQQLSDECPDEYPQLIHEWETIDIVRAQSEWLDCLVDAHRDFASAVLDARSPMVDGEEGTRAVELANAIYLSSLEQRVVELPLERGEYVPWFEALVAGSLAI
ncbi:MAG: Gfo/Idh/MocA family protein [Acidimicrobiia bacterium]